MQILHTNTANFYFPRISVISSEKMDATFFQATVMTLSILSDRSGQTVKTPEEAVWSGSTLFAILSAFSSFVTEW